MTRRRLRLWPLLAFTHRWLGIAGGLLFLLWFVSGIAMMYVRMPALTVDERLAHAQPLSADLIRMSPAEAAVRAGIPDTSPLEIGMQAGRPVYRLGDRVPTVVYADTGELLRPPSADEAVAEARSFVGPSGPAVRHVERLLAPDQWTLQLRSHFPLHRLAVEGSNGAELYVSSVTGDVVLDTTRRERVLAYVGPVAHWLYLPVLRRNGPLWTQVILWSSGVGCVLCLSGLLAGILRCSPGGRFRLFHASGMSPYNGWLRWHHCAGLLFGVVTLTWTFSGLLSMGPFSLLSNDGLAARITGSVAGITGNAAFLSAEDVRLAARALQSAVTLKQMRLIAFQGQQYWLGAGSTERHSLVSAKGPWTAFDGFSRVDVEAAARAAGNDAPAELSWITTHDEYYYDDRARRRPLPVLRARYADSSSTWTYLDPAQGSVVMTLGVRDRWNRWLYHGLHSLDPLFLRDRRPLWDVVVIALSLGGIAGAATSLVPAWRRLRGLSRGLAGTRTASPLGARPMSEETQ